MLCSQNIQSNKYTSLAETYCILYKNVAAVVIIQQNYLNYTIQKCDKLFRKFSDNLHTQKDYADFKKLLSRSGN